MDTRPAFVIWAPPYSEQWGGVMALHNLADRLVKRGFTVSVSENPNVEHASRDIIAIYPEVTTGNPLNARHVVRWLLNTPGVRGGDGVYGDSDLIFLWSKRYLVPHNRKPDGELELADFHEDLFRDRGGPRKGCCYVVRKGAGSIVEIRRHQKTYHPAGAVNIDDYFQRGGNAWLADAFNRFETFISYDHHTQLLLIAAQCGCDSVVVPDGRSLGEWIDSEEYIPGIAWGLEDIERARVAREALPMWLDSRRKESSRQFDRFVEIVASAWKEKTKPVVKPESTIRGECRDYLVYCPCRHGTVSADLFGSHRLFDVALNDYTGDKVHDLLAEYSFSIPGHKWPVIRSLPGLFAPYRAVCFLDDDVEIDTDGLNRLFRAGDSLGLSLWQASLTEDSHTIYSYLKHKSGGYAREVPLVEVMAPVFSQRALQDVWFNLHESESGYGLDYLWPKLLGGKGLAVVDAVQMQHANESTSAEWILSNGKTPRQEAAEMLTRHQIDPRPYWTWLRPTIFLGMPHSGNPVAEALDAFWLAGSKTCDVIKRRNQTSALCRNFNILWSEAVNLAEKNPGVEFYFSMQHDDNVPMTPGHLDIMREELIRTGAAVVACCPAIKDDRGLVSTAIEDPFSAPWDVAKRLTTTELQSLPETFDAADCGYPGRAILANTGCWMANLRHPCFQATGDVMPIFFTMRDNIVRNPKTREWVVRFQPEDWLFSHLVQQHGGRVMVTRKVAVGHVGPHIWPNHIAWGRLTEDDCGVVAALRELAKSCEAA